MTEAPDSRRSHLPTPAYADVEIDLTHLVFRGLLPNVCIAIVSTTGATVLLALQFHDSFLWIMSVFTLAVCLSRLAIVLGFHRIRAELSMPRARRWQRTYGFATILYCCFIATTALRTFNTHPLDGGWLCTLGIFCICIALSSRTGLRPWMMYICGSILIGSLAFAIVHSGHRLSWAGACLLLFFAYQFWYSVDNQFHLAVEQLRIRRQLRILSEQDTLTGLSNRRHFEAALAALCASGDVFAILFIDLDRFKHVNDRYGHAAGDALLIEVAHRIRSSIRPSDLLARLGGDEFAILQTPLLSADSAKALAARINNDIGEPFHIDGNRIGIGASIGIRLADAAPSDANTLLSKADQALYLVKQAGGGSFQLANA